MQSGSTNPGIFAKSKIPFSNSQVIKIFAMKQTKALLSHTSEALMELLKSRFEKNLHRHKGIRWADVQRKLEEGTEKLWSLSEMERTGGEPDVIGFDKVTGQFLFCDCSPETPAGRRSVCYDGAARDARKEHKPETSALEMAAAIGIEILAEAQYRELQELGNLDTKTSSWIRTPPAIRELGGALFGDFRYGSVFVYHNGASSYYSNRGFRGMLKL
jgi:hypothetical protein